jgi:LysM repeat protein
VDYTVEPGDSLLGIAGQFDASVDALRLANGLTNVDMLRIGQVLVIPPAETLLQPVEPTRTLRDIALQYSEDPAVLAAYNGVDPARVGAPLGRDTVILPDRSRIVVSPPGSGAPASPEQTIYTVAEGDTLLSIAVEFDVDPDAILAANQLTDPNLIFVGQELRIPSTE